MQNIKVEDRYLELVISLVAQIKNYEIAYGYLPECQLVVREDYKKLVELANKSK